MVMVVIVEVVVTIDRMETCNIIFRREKCNIKAISEEKFAEAVCSGPTVNYMSAAEKFRFHDGDGGG